MDELCWNKLIHNHLATRTCSKPHDYHKIIAGDFLNQIFTDPASLMIRGHEEDTPPRKPKHVFGFRTNWLSLIFSCLVEMFFVWWERWGEMGWMRGLGTVVFGIQRPLLDPPVIRPCLSSSSAPPCHLAGLPTRHGRQAPSSFSAHHDQPCLPLLVPQRWDGVMTRSKRVDQICPLWKK